MKTYSFFCFLLSAFLITGCSNAENSGDNADYQIVTNPEYGPYQQEEAPPFQFELLETITPDFPDDFILSGFNHLLTDADKNFYFMDRQQSKLISLAPDGSLRWITGEKGRGPGDFENTYSMITDDNRLFIGNLQGSRLDIFDYDGNFLESRNMAEEVSFGTLWGFLSTGEIVFAGPNWDSWGPHINIIEIAGDSIKIKEDFIIDQSGDIETIQGMTSRSTISVHEDEIHTGSVIDYSLETHSPNGELIRKITRDFDRIVRPGMLEEGNSSTIRSYGSVNAPFLLPNGFFLVTAIWPTNVSDPDQFIKLSNNGTAPDLEYQSTIDVYDPDGNLLYSFENNESSPDIGPIQHIDENGFIYTIEMEPEPKIHKYRLVVQEDYGEIISF